MEHTARRHHSGPAPDSVRVRDTAPIVYILVRFSPLLAGSAALILLACWLLAGPPLPKKLRTPLNQVPRYRKGESQTVDIRGSVQRFAGEPAALAGAWPRFRGEGSDNIAAGAPALRAGWPSGRARIHWRVSLGEGYAGAAVSRGRVFVLDYDEKKMGDALRCFSLQDGREIWRRFYSVKIKRNHGRSRTVPAVSEELVVSIGPRCQVLCAAPGDGRFLWGLDMVRRFQTKVPLWYTGQCPLIDRGRVILAPGGAALLVAVDGTSGRILWQVPNPDQWQMSHASVIPMEFAGVRMFVYPALGGVFAVGADGPLEGKLLWKSTDWNHSVVAPSAVKVGRDRIFLTTGHGGGSIMLQVVRQGAGFVVRTLYRLEKEVFACEQQTPIFYKNHIYGILPADAGPNKQLFACLSPEGKLLWTSDRTHRFGLGPFMLADNKFYILEDSGELTVAAADHKGWRELGRVRILKGRDAWAPLALVGTRLLLRDNRTMVCVELAPGKEPPRG